jgi:hypothetical protein
VAATGTPFDILAERLASENSRGDWTPLELFLAAVEKFPGKMAMILATLSTP